MATQEDRTEDMRRFGEELKRRRQDAGYRYAKDFATAIGLSPGYLSGIETAYAKNDRPPAVPDLDTIDKISDFLEWPKVEMLMLMGFMDENDLRATLPDPTYEPILEEFRGAAHDGSLSPDDVEEIAELIRLRRARRRRSLS